MPLVFFVGGAANAISWRGTGPARWHGPRLDGGTTTPPRLAGAAARGGVTVPLPHLLPYLGMPQPVVAASRPAGQWHMSALSVITSVVVVGLGVPAPEPGTSAWLSGWPHWLLMLALAGLMLTWSAPASPRPGLFEAEASPGGPTASQMKSP
jgi:hypothetical protein